MNKQFYLEAKELFDQYESLSEGESVRINHDTEYCEGSSKSLIIKRNEEDGLLYAKCYRCGCYSKSRAVSAASLKSKLLGEEGSDGHTDIERDNQLPDRCTSDINRWPSHAKAWVWKAGITDGEINDIPIYYSDAILRCVLPVYDMGRNLVSYQTRRVFREDTAPKYITYGDNSSIIQFGDSNGELLVIVEDYLSGVRVGRHTPCLVLNGTSLQGHHLKWILYKGYTKFLLFLDDDNATVKKNQVKIKQTLDMIGNCMIYHSNGKDPKEHTDTELKEIIDGSL